MACDMLAGRRWVDMIVLWILVAGLTATVAVAAGALVSRSEGYHRAGRRLGVVATLVLGLTLLGALWPEGRLWTPVAVSLAGGWLMCLGLLVPWPARTLPEDGIPPTRIDERTTMFSRNELEEDGNRAAAYYEEYPADRAVDRRFRGYPGLMSPEAREANRLAFASASSSFLNCSHLGHGSAAELGADPYAVDAAEITSFLKGWALHMGARGVGVATMAPYHWYSVLGRGDRYGRTVGEYHRFGLVITVEMDHRLLGTGPRAPTVMESALRYQHSGVIAVQVAHMIRSLGYRARAHLDGDYEVVCPLVARDAGMGEIGRMGLLMTPDLGPRVRIAVVTTDLELIPDPRRYDGSMIDFCERCRKCATVCPSRAIPRGPRTTTDGSTRWKIDQAACFSYWCESGTDCGRCVAACPYSHPDTLVHRMVRRSIRHSALFRRVAARADDLLYGRIPERPKPPDWLAPALRREKPGGD